MLSCNICGSTSFENHDGFMYCTECQTQSQEYCEMEYEHTEGVTKRTVKTKRVRKKKDELSEQDCWTTWEAFNFILHGMTEQLKELGAPQDFNIMVLKLWSCYLCRCDVAFTSRVKENKPKLGFAHHRRDSMVLYNVQDCMELEKSPGKKRSRSRSRSTTASSAKRLKNRIADSDYEAHSSSFKTDTLGNETIESVGRGSDSDGVADSSFDKSSAKEILRSTDRCKYWESVKDPNLIKSLIRSSKSEGRYVDKRKLIAILHLALLLTDSEIQLSDLLRFIREGHLSYAKVTHFFPEGLRVASGDVSYIECMSDVAMPSHHHQRKETASMAALLETETISPSNAVSLIKRYCFELNLPDSIFALSEKVFAASKSVRRTNNTGFEALAMAVVIFVMKLLFGLDGTTELLLSDFAAKVNSAKRTGSKLFVFRDWQRHLECRKAVINRFHSPTREQLTKDCFESSMNFVESIAMESKDEHRDGRFKINSEYLMERTFLEAVKKAASALTEPHVAKSLNFPPCLTPQRTYLDVILKAYAEGGKHGGHQLPDIQASVLDMLKMDFGGCDTDFVREPEAHVEALRSNGFNVVTKSELDSNPGKLSEGATEKGQVPRGENILTDRLGVDVAALSASRTVVVVAAAATDDASDYWVLRCPARMRTAANFKSSIVDNASVNFRWLLLECSRMLEMNAKDLYGELFLIESKMLRLQKRMTVEREIRADSGKESATSSEG